MNGRWLRVAAVTGPTLGCMASLAPSALSADLFHGSTAAAVDSPAATLANPASGVFLERTTFQWSPILYRDSAYDITYEGHEPTSQESSGPKLVRLPTYVVKPSPRLAFSALVLPELPAQEKTSRIPLALLGAPNELDLKSTSKAKFLAHGSVSYRLAPRLGLGVAVSHARVQLEGTFRDVKADSKLADLSQKTTQTRATVGARYILLAKALELGLATRIYEKNETTQGLEIAVGGLGGDDEPETKSQQIFFRNILVGVKGALASSLTATADFALTRAYPDQEDTTLTDFKTRSRDVRDRYSVRTGLVWRMHPRWSLLAGGRYEQGAVGDGSKTQNGYGGVDLIRVLLGNSLGPYWNFVKPLRPFWEVTLGTEFRFGLNAVGDKGHYPSWALATGVGYRKATRKVGSEGTLPATYKETRVFVPARITYRF